MKEKVLALLLAKFTGVRKDGLAHLAGAIALQAATDEEANAIIGKLTAESVNAYIGDIRKEIDSEIGKANKTYEDGLKKKFDFVEKKEPPKNDPPKPDDPNEPAWFKSYRELQEKKQSELQEKLNLFETSSRKEKLKGLAITKLKEKGIPESFVGSIDIDSEDKIEEFITSQETRFTAFKQEQVNTGNWVDKPLGGGSKSNTEQEALGKQLAEKANGANKPDSSSIAGRELK